MSEFESQSFITVPHNSRRSIDHSDPRRTQSQPTRGVLTEQAQQIRKYRRHQSHLEAMAPRSTRNSAKSPNSGGDNPTQGQPYSSKKQVDQIKALQAQLAATQKENQDLETGYQAQIAQLKGKKGQKSRGIRIPISEEVAKEIVDEGKTILWRTSKFLSDEDELFAAMALVLSHIPELNAKFLVDNEDKDDYVQAFVDNYGTKLTNAVNTSQSNAQQGLRKAYVKRCIEGKKMPTPKDMLNLAMRKDLEFDPNDPKKNEENRELFLWYWDELLPKMAGSKRWGYSIRNYGCISSYCYPDSDTKYITSSDEAMIVVMFENCGQRFPYAAKCTKKGEKIKEDHPDNQAKYSDSTAGQSKYGGWNLEGRTRYNKIRKLISKAKRDRKKEIKAIEKLTLKELRSKNGLNKKKSLKRKGRTPKDFEGKEEAKTAMVGVESDDETDIEAEEIELEEFDGRYPEPKKPKTKQGDVDLLEEEDESGSEGEEEDGED